VNVLGVETSCDESAASVVGADGVRADIIYSQRVHEAYGGVVPELAARAHLERIAAVVEAALTESGVSRPDAVAATAGPGLVGAVLVGFSWAKALARAWDVPFIGVNHLEGHLLSPRLDEPDLVFPYLGLVVSGGHTALYLVEGLGRYQTLGQTVDDAVGEAFDKVARMMDLGYPGGPVVDRMAALGDATALTLPRPRVRGEPMAWSFAGLKTAVRQALAREVLDPKDVCAAFQEAAVDSLMSRVRLAMKQTGVRRLALAGGVAANEGLRSAALALKADGVEVFVPPKTRCTDNGSMIAYAGRCHLMAGRRDRLDMTVRAQWPVA